MCERDDASKALRTMLGQRISLVPAFLARFGAAKGVESCMGCLGIEIKDAIHSVAGSALGAQRFVGLMQSELRSRVSSWLTSPETSSVSNLWTELQSKQSKPAAPRDATPAGVRNALSALAGEDIARALQSLLTTMTAASAPSTMQSRLADLLRSTHTMIDVFSSGLRESILALQSQKAAALEQDLERFEAALQQLRAVHMAVHDALQKSDDEVAAAAADLTARLKYVDELLAVLPHVHVELPVIILEVNSAKPLRTACTASFVYPVLISARAEVTVPPALPKNKPGIDDAISWFIEKGVLAHDPLLQELEFSRLRNPQSASPDLVALYKQRREVALSLIGLVRGGEHVATSPPRSEKFDLSMFPGFELHGPLRCRPDAVVQRLQHSTNCKEHGVLLMEQYLAFVSEIRTDPHAVLVPRMLDMAALWLGASSTSIAAHVLGHGHPTPSEELLRTVIVEESTIVASRIELFVSDLERYGPGLVSHFRVFGDLDDRSVKEHFGRPQRSCRDSLGQQRR